MSVCLLAAGPVQAGLLNRDLTNKIINDTNKFAQPSFDTNPYPGSFVASLIKAFLGILGIIFIILIIYAGYNWLTAGGEEEKVRKAKDTIKRAVIGLIIIAASYAITAFVFKNLPSGTGSPLTGS
jgi:amino acid transporter